MKNWRPNWRLSNIYSETRTHRTVTVDRKRYLDKRLRKLKLLFPSLELKICGQFQSHLTTLAVTNGTDAAETELGDRPLSFLSGRLLVERTVPTLGIGGSSPDNRLRFSEKRLSECRIACYERTATPSEDYASAAIGWGWNGTWVKKKNSRIIIN